MNVASRPVATGKTRTCPHCKATILESLSICPGCMHHLRFDSEAAKRQVAAAPALKVEGIIRHPPLDQPQEYFVIIAIRNDRGEEVTRQVVGVGALQPSEKRTFSLSVEVLPPMAPAKSTSSTGTFKAPAIPQGAPATANPAAAPAASSGVGANTSAPPPKPPAPGAAPTNAGPGQPAQPAPAGTPKASYPGGLKPPVPGAPKPPLPGGFKKH